MELRSALRVQAKIRTQPRAGVDLCFCADDYEPEKFGHSVACGAANLALGTGQAQPQEREPMPVGVTADGKIVFR